MGQLFQIPDSLQNKTVQIMIVDDEPAFRSVLEEILTAFGFHVLAFGAVKDALLQLETTTPDLILTDIMMPDIDGYQFLCTLKEEPKWAQIPVGMLSALARPEDRQKGLDFGAAGYLAKPFTAVELRRMITEILQASDP